MLGHFVIDEPATLQDACALLAEHGADAAVYAGGTELLPLMKEGLVAYSRLVNIKTIPGLDTVAVDAGRGELQVGPLATHRLLARSPVVREHAPLLAETAARVANVRVRAAGTIGGNLCFAEPHSDPATLLLAWDASLDLTSTGSCRTVAIGDFFVGFLETARRPDEILSAIHVPLRRDCFAGSAYEKFSLHERPTVTVAVYLEVDDGVISTARVAVGSVDPVPLRIIAAEEALRRERPADGLFARAASLAAAAVDPVDDLYGSVEYKRHLAGVFVRSALARAARDATEGGDL